MKERQATYVTGASGFIGKHLCERLDNFVAIPHDKIETYPLKPYDYFYFLSAYGNMAQHTDEKAILQANINDLVSIIRKTDFNDIKGFVFTSTSSIKLPIQTMYSRTKRAAEEILLSFTEKYGAPIVIIRPFSVTGVGEQESHLIPTLIRSCLSGEEMDFVSYPVHDFIDVEDLISGIQFLVERGAKGIFELGTGEGYSNELVKEMVEEVTGKKANVREVRNMRSYDTIEWVSKNPRVRNMGWSPRKTLKQSIIEMVEAYHAK